MVENNKIPLNGDLLNSPEYILWISLAQTHNIIAKARNSLIDRLQIPPTQGAALYFININNNGVTIENLANYLFLNRNSVSELVTRMENKGWVKRLREVGDNYRVKIVSTKKGEHACDKATKPELIYQIMSSLSSEQRQQLESILDTLREKALVTYKAKGTQLKNKKQKQG
jgi:DNA-binding MarR family transcriptional regulator